LRLRRGKKNQRLVPRREKKGRNVRKTAARTRPEQAELRHQKTRKREKASPMARGGESAEELVGQKRGESSSAVQNPACSNRGAGGGGGKGPGGREEPLSAKQKDPALMALAPAGRRKGGRRGPASDSRREPQYALGGGGVSFPRVGGYPS